MLMFNHKLALFVTIVFTISSILKKTPAVDDSKQSRILTSSISDSHVLGKKILVAIPSYGRNQFIFLQDMIDSFHDLCEMGSHVDIIIYATEPYTLGQIHMFNARKKCYHPMGKLNIKIKIKPAYLKLHFVDAHRKDFYDFLNEYDLFIYTEDDHQVRPSHVVAYLAETAKLKSLVGKEAFPNYSIGFMRYERDLNLGTRFNFDQYKYKNAGLHAFSNPVLSGLYVGNTRMPHQGMFMATAEQLELWRDRCQFDEIDPDNVESESTPTWHREFVSSLRLFTNEGVEKNCKVTQLFPADAFENFMIHHMADKYYTNPSFEKDKLLSSEKLQEVVLKMTTENKDIDKNVGLNGKYNGVTMEILEEDMKGIEVNDKEVYNKVVEGVNEFQHYVQRGGSLNP